jgi:hypothetical protein
MHSRQFGLALTGAVVFLIGCQRASEVTWSAQSKSADGTWLALARTEHTEHGLGGESQNTIVEMKQNNPGSKPVQVLVFDEGPQSAKGLIMTWPSTHHLDIRYRGDVPIIFQASKAFGNEVTVERLP